MKKIMILACLCAVRVFGQDSQYHDRFSLEVTDSIAKVFAEARKMRLELFGMTEEEASSMGTTFRMMQEKNERFDKRYYAQRKKENARLQKQKEDKEPWKKYEEKAENKSSDTNDLTSGQRAMLRAYLSGLK